VSCNIRLAVARRADARVNGLFWASAWPSSASDCSDFFKTASLGFQPRKEPYYLANTWQLDGVFVRFRARPFAINET
jgi:hypothetical protein